MARSNIPTPEEALAGMAQVGSPRQPMGSSWQGFNDATGDPSRYTHPVAKHDTQAGDPVGNDKANRKGIAYPTPAGVGDRNGAAYRISASFPPSTSPEAGATQGNGRIIGATRGQSGAFADERGYDRS